MTVSAIPTLSQSSSGSPEMLVNRRTEIDCRSDSAPGCPPPANTVPDAPGRANTSRTTARGNHQPVRRPQLPSALISQRRAVSRGCD